MRKIFLFVIGVFVLSGCYGMTAVRNRNSLNHIEIGMSRNHVVAIMGNPHKREAYEGIEYLLYRTEHTADGMITNDEMTPLAFENDILVGWGRNYYRRKKERIEADINIQDR